VSWTVYFDEAVGSSDALASKLLVQAKAGAYRVAVKVPGGSRSARVRVR
jgi:hypothetical protein